MTGGFCWESILEYVSSYNPLDSGVDSACAGFASIGFALSALLSGYSTAKYGYLGYLVLFIQKQGMLCLRTSVIFANFQDGLGALFRVFLIYMAKFRIGLARMTLYTYATFISGSQLLWVSPSKRSYRRLFLVAQLSMLRAGYAGEGTTSYIFKTQLEKSETTSRKKIVNNGRQTTPDGTDQTPINICGWGTNGTMTRPGCTCYHADDWLVGCVEPAAPARESCVCLFLDGRWNLTLKDGAAEAQEKKPEPKPEDDRSTKRGNARKMRNRIRKKLFVARLPGTILGTVLAAVFSTEVFIKISTVVTMISYNLFFWMGAQCYDLGEMENYEITDEIENNSCEMEEHDKKNEEKNDGKDEEQIPNALVPELKKAAAVVLKLLPLWLTFASTCYLVNATGDSFFMDQVDYLQNNTESFKIPTSVFNAFPEIVSFITDLVSDYLFKYFYDEEKKARWARLLRISIGMLFSSLCCIVASLVAYRLDSNYNSASMLWLLPQFLLWGMMKGILQEGLVEFLHPDHLDDELKAEAVCGVAEAVGYFLSMILTAVSPSSWFGYDISESHLGNYYRMLAIITLFSTFVFTIVAIAYELREKEDTVKSGKKY